LKTRCKGTKKETPESVSSLCGRGLQLEVEAEANEETVGLQSDVVALVEVS